MNGFKDREELWSVVQNCVSHINNDPVIKRASTLTRLIVGYYYPDMHFGWTLRIGNGRVMAELDQAEFDIEVEMESATYRKLLKGEINPIQAHMTGEIIMKGPVSRTVRLQPFLKPLQTAYKELYKPEGCTECESF
ncbi:MAG: SCP2 sterol-binding domain-containing protein [bacterium]